MPRGVIQPFDEVWKLGAAFSVAASQVAGLFAASQQFTPVTTNSPSGLTVPLLISAISNIVVGLVWLSTFVGVIIAVPLFILSIFEFTLYAKIGTQPLQQTARQTRAIAIWELVLGIFNTPTLVCGIILMINSGKYR